MPEVVVNTESLQLSRSGGISGQIYLKSPAGEFPESGWSDFPVVILAWWLEGLSSVASGSARSFEGVFMEGPFSFTVESGTGNMVRVSWGERSKQSSIGIFNLPGMLSSVAEAAKQVVLCCKSNGWRSADIDSLERVLSRVAG